MVGWLLTGSGWLMSVRQVMSNCGMRMIVPSYERIASSTPLYVMPESSSTHGPPPLVLPVAATYCQDGRTMAGLSGFRIEQTISLAPPAGGSQSSQPTLPGAALQRGTVRTVFHGHSWLPGTGSLLPSQLIVVTGMVTGRTAQ